MASKAIQRTLLIVALVATAHLLKPFSLWNVTTHLIHSASSFSFILPDSAAGSLEQASYLATALDNGFRMMEARQGSNLTLPGATWANQTTFASNLTPPQAQSENVKAFTAASPCRHAAKPVAKTLAKAKPQKVKNLIAVNVTKLEEKAVEKAMTVTASIPALEVENMIAVSLPRAKAPVPAIPVASSSHRAPATNFILASPSKSCQMEEIKPPQRPLTLEEAEQRLKASLQQIVYNANSIRVLCAKERSRLLRNGVTQIIMKPC